MEKSFKEVITTIKPREVWEDECFMIFLDDEGFIRIENLLEVKLIAIHPDRKFKRKRRKYTFEEAFKAYEEGKEIEGICKYRYKKISGIDFMYSTTFDEFLECHDGIYIKEIRGMWYIND